MISYLLSKGLRTQEIADIMGIHRVTVSRYKQEIRRQYCGLERSKTSIYKRDRRTDKQKTYIT